VKSINQLGLEVASEDENKSAEPVAPLSQIKIISHKEKTDWNLVAKYNIGKKRKEE